MTKIDWLRSRTTHGARRRLALAVGAALFSLVVLGAAPSAWAVTYLVTSTGDAGDQDLSDPTCWTGGIIDIGGGQSLFECTLRAAIEQANASISDDTIEFWSDLPVVANTVTISPGLLPLPTITDDLLIDGYSAPGYDMADPLANPVINLNGASSSLHGLDVAIGTGESVTIRGLAIYDFDFNAIEAVMTGAGTFRVQGCHLGVNRGVFYLGNSRRGLLVDAAAGAVVIGQDCTPGTSSCSGKGNLISGNDSDGMRIIGNSTTDVTIHGNRIGTDKSGNVLSVPFGGITLNDGWGIRSEISPAQISGNLVSGNITGGIRVEGFGASVFGNTVGTNLAGTAALPNEGPGIDVFGDLTTVGRLGEENLVSGNVGAGIISEGANTIAHNTIGLTRDGTGRLSNQGNGVELLASGSTVESNTIGGDAAAGVYALGSDHVIRSNFVGTNEAGADLGNPGSVGIANLGARITIGGTAGEGNVVGFYRDGILLTSVAEEATVVGNHVGTNAEGDDLGNVEAGIETNASGPLRSTIGVVGGRDLGGANVVGFNDIGIHIRSLADANVVTGNFVGTDSTGADLGNDSAGILVTESFDSVIGAIDLVGLDVAAAGNEIAFNGGDGIALEPGLALPFVDGISMVGNVFRSNGGQEIDLGGDGTTPNDPGDADTGTANDLLNTPELDATEVDIDLAAGLLEVRYRVDTLPANATYPLTVHFYYRADTLPGAASMVYLGSDVYPAVSAGQFVDVLLRFPNAMPYIGSVVATATDDAPSPRTSELSEPPVPVPEPAIGASLLAGALALAGFASRRAPNRAGEFSGRRRGARRACR